MRGKRHSGWAYHCARRIIPAHAGQTLRRHPPRRLTPDHPRACGANVPARAFGIFARGSSPRMRGKRFVGRDAIKMHRIIPAHAGQTGLTFPGWGRTSDHPRACGANTTIARELFGNCGSSPRMRGKLTTFFCFHAPSRIIPAHAGQTHQAAGSCSASSDHPRACGANLLEFFCG